MTLVIELATYLAISAALYWWLSHQFGVSEKDSEHPTKRKIMTVAILAFIGCWVGVGFWGQTRPGVPFERWSYETYVYVHLFPDDKSVKSYHVPAKLVSGSDGYVIEYAIMPNGGRIHFDGSDTGLYPDEKCTLWGTGDRMWDVIMTSQPARVK